MEKGIITSVVPRNSWLHPFIGYEIEFNNVKILLKGYYYRDINYLKRGYIKKTI